MSACYICLTSMQMRDLRRTDVTQKSYADTRSYNYDELYVVLLSHPLPIPSLILLFLDEQVLKLQKDKLKRFNLWIIHLSFLLIFVS
jgi:hypothetical protein